MDGGATYLVKVLVLLSAAVLSAPLFRALRFGPILGYLVAGVVVGPHGLGLIADVGEIRRMGEFGVVFLLFTIGLELKMSRLSAMRRLVFGLGSAQVLVTGAVLAGALLPLVTLPVAVVVGGSLALSSTAVVLPMLMERGEMSTRTGRTAFAVLLMQDLAVVVLLLVVESLGDGSASPAAGMAQNVGRAVVAGLALAAMGRLLAPPFLRFMTVARSAEMFAAAVLLVVLGFAWAAGRAGLSMGLGAFLAGLLLADTEFRHQVEADIQPYRGFLLGLFFMAVGMSLDLSFLARDFVSVLVLLLALILIKSALLMALTLAFGLGLEVAAHVGLLLAQGGEFAFVVLAQGWRRGVIDGNLVQLAVLVVTASMMVTPLLAVVAAKVAARFHIRPENLGRLEDLAGISGHVVIAGFGRVGQTVARLLERQAVPYVALDISHDRVAAAREQRFPVYFADATRPEVLRAAGTSRARAVVLTLDRAGAAERAMARLRHGFPDVPVFARARDHEHSGALKSEGAAMAVPETVEASLHLGASVLRVLGASDVAVDELIAEIRRDDYAALVRLYPRSGGE